MGSSSPGNLYFVCSNNFDSTVQKTDGTVVSPQTSPSQSLPVSSSALPQFDYSATTGFSPVSRTWWWWVEICLHPALCGLDLLSFVFSDEHRVAASTIVRLFLRSLLKITSEFPSDDPAFITRPPNILPMCEVIRGLFLVRWKPSLLLLPVTFSFYYSYC